MLREKNNRLERQMLIERPENANAFAKSFESWLRNHKTTVITSEDIARKYGVATYDAVKLAIKENLVARYASLGALHDVLEVKTEPMPKELKWGEVLVQVLACPINGLDVSLARWYRIPGEDPDTHYPVVAGSDGVGIIRALEMVSQTKAWP